MKEPMTFSRIAAAVAYFTVYTLALTFLCRVFLTDEITAERWLQIGEIWLLGVIGILVGCGAVTLAQRRDRLRKAQEAEDYHANWQRTVERNVGTLPDNH